MTDATKKTKAPAKKNTAKPLPKDNKATVSSVESDEKQTNRIEPENRQIIEVAQKLASDPSWREFVQEQNQKLLDLRDELLDNVAGVTRDTLRSHPEGSEASGSGEHTGDAGSDAYDREFALSLLSKGQDALYDIDAALNRIQNGVYGICEISYQPIPRPRLEAIPFARLTVECQAQWEKEHGLKTRFRPEKSDFGYSSGQIDLQSASVLLDEDED